MEKTEKKNRLIKSEIKLTVFHPPGEEPEFSPWEAGEMGGQNFLKIQKNNENAFLYMGERDDLEAEMRKAVFKLTNDGWCPQGEVSVEFDGTGKEEGDEFFERDLIRLEVGLNLLPLVDPGQGAPLVEMVKGLRKDIVRVTGFITPGIRISDNLTLPQNNYVIYIKETPISAGEVFLDRFLALGPAESLAALKGWSTKDPAFNSPAKWIEFAQKDEAEVAGCILMGSLNVIITHLREAVISNLKELLGLQEVKILLDKLMQSHPVVVEDFVNDKKKIRLVRQILRNLMSERVSIRDLVTIMETLGDHEEELHKTDKMTEIVRMALARQICWTYLNEEGKIPALVLSRKFEEKIQYSIRDTKFGVRLTLTAEEADAIIRNIRKTLEDYKNPQVIFCDPPSRLYVRKLTELNFPHLGILSTAEITKGMKIEILGDVDLPEDVKPGVPPPPADEEDGDIEEAADEKKESKGFFSFLK
ncbi:MAG: flagellar biosynthesis protein FlhA [Firmicutes bacterium]|nr:flagellar biosynthesis protein FlhA [Bacillota bacterium]